MTENPKFIRRECGPEFRASTYLEIDFSLSRPNRVFRDSSKYLETMVIREVR